MPIESIASTLGTGSGIDTTKLVSELVEAQFAAKNKSLTAQSEKLEAQISSAGEIKSAIAAFSTALNGLAKGGTLRTQPTSSNSAIATVSALAGANITTLDARLEVRQLAASQTAATPPVGDAKASVGQGSLHFALGTATVADGAMTGFSPSGTTFDITIGAGQDSLEGIRDAINAANRGVTASILSDAEGARLVLKGPSGATQAFTMTASETAGHEGLSALNIGVGAAGTTIGTAAADAIVAVDGVAVRRATNAISDLIPGVKIDLAAASPGTTLRIGASAPLDSLNQVVADFVESYKQLNQMLTQAMGVDGPLRSDPAAKALKRSLSALTLAPLVTDGASGTPATLSAIGVATNRDGSLTLDSGALARSLIANPGAVESMFREGAGLPKALADIAATATSTTAGLGASEARYTAAKQDLTENKDKILEATEALRNRMTQQFAAMDAKVAAYKSTQTFLDQQVEAWNASRG